MPTDTNRIFLLKSINAWLLLFIFAMLAMAAPGQQSLAIRAGCQRHRPSDAQSLCGRAVRAWCCPQHLQHRPQSRGPRYSHKRTYTYTHMYTVHRQAERQATTLSFPLHLGMVSASCKPSTGKAFSPCQTSRHVRGHSRVACLACVIVL